MLGLLDDFFCRLEGTSKPEQLLHSVNTVFNKKLSDFERNGFRLTDRNDYFSCGYPTQNLLKCGLKGNQEIVLTQSVVKKAIGLARGKSDEAHALQVSDLKDLPSKLHHPVLVITGNLSSSRLIFVEINQTGRKVMAVIHMEKHSEKGVVSAIVTIYSKPSKVVGLLIEQACARNEVWYYDEKKLGDWLSVTGQLQLLPRIKANPLNGAANIAQKSAQVKFIQKNLLKRIYRADDCTDTRDCIINLYECFEAIKLLELNGQPHGMINTRVFQLTKRYAALAKLEGLTDDWQTALNRYRNESLGTLDVETIEEVSHIIGKQARQHEAESSNEVKDVAEANQKATELEEAKGSENAEPPAASITNPVNPGKSEKVEVVEIPVTKIHTDEKRFQNRINAFSEESKNRIVNAVKNGTFDWAKFDPITIWLDPKNNKYYVLSGHSRLAAFRELSTGNSDFKNIPAKVFKGGEKDAIDFALNSNTLATRETEVERAIYYNKQRMLCEVKKGLNGKTECEKLVEQQCRENEGKNANYILNLSYLNPKGFLMDNLMRLGIEKDNDSTNVLRTIANWVGEARRSNPEISDTQETEIAQFLLNGGYGNKAGQFRNKQQFMERLDYSFAKWKSSGANPSKSLNLANTLSKSSFEKEWDERLAKAKEDLDNAIAEHEEKYKKYLFAVMEGKISQERMDELMKPIVAYVERAKQEYDRVRGQKDEVKKAASAQTSLWGIDDDMVNGLTRFSKTRKVKTYKLAGELGKFLGEYDRNRYSIVIRGDKGAGKSRLLYQLINAFASKGLRVAFLSLEMSIFGSITQKYKKEYINRKNLNRIHVTDNAPTLEQLQNLCNDYDVLAIDSWTKLLGVSQTDFDALLRKNPQTIVLSIFQSTTDKVTRGGNMPEYDSAVVIHVHK